MEASLRRILVAVDFSEPGMNALDLARAYAKRFEASVVLVHVLYLTSSMFGAGTFAMPDTVDQITIAAKDELGKLVSAVTSDGIRCEGVVMNGIPDEEITRFAADPKNQIDLIVVGTHGRTGLARVAFGSVAQRILQAAPCPALVVPSRREPS